MPPPFRHSIREIVEPDDFDDAVSGVSLKVEFQRRQQRPSRVEQFQSAGWALDFGETSVATRVSGVLNGGWASFCLSLGPGPASWNGHAAPPGSIGLLPPGAEVSGRTADGFAWVTAAVPPEVWSRCLALAGVEEMPGALSVGALDPAVDAAIRGELASGRARLGAGGGELERGDPIAAGLLEAFVRAIESTIDGRRVALSVMNRTRLARRAEGWMRDHLGEAVRVPEVCLAVGVSRRELEYAFRMVFDQSPRERLEMLRLHAIRKALRHCDGTRGTVIRIAYDHGISHLGRFAARYRLLFGENPGETAKAKGRG